MSANAGGFGISPPSLREHNLVKGSHLERVIYLVQGNPDIALELKVEVDSADIKDWITFPSGQSLIIPKGVQQYPFSVVVDVPSDAELGIYKAFIRINTVPKNAENTGEVAISIGGRVDVDITVGDDVIYEYNIKAIDILDIKEGDKPRIEVKIRNTGNVPAAPDNATFELFNKYGDIRLAYAEGNTFTKVPSFSEGTSAIEFPMDIRLAPGEYWGHVKIYDDKGAIIKDQRTVFNVNPKTLVEKYLIHATILLAAILLYIIYRIYRRIR